MNYNFNIDSKDLNQIVLNAETALKSSEILKFERTKSWRANIPRFPCVYALYEKKETLIYIGETGNLQKRMSEICRAGGHAFRRQLGCKNMKALLIKGKKKFEPETEMQIDSFLDNDLYVSFIEVNFGRLEIETYLITKNQKFLLNSEKKRKLII